MFKVGFKLIKQPFFKFQMTSLGTRPAWNPEIVTSVLSSCFDITDVKFVKGDLSDLSGDGGEGLEGLLITK